MKRNDGLLIKGNHITIRRARYDRIQNVTSHIPTKRPVQTTRINKAWIPAHRDSRTYKEIVQKQTLTREVPRHVPFEEILKHGVVCYFKDGYDTRTSIRELEYKGILDNLATSRFDSISCIINKIQKSENIVESIDDTTMEKIKECF